VRLDREQRGIGLGARDREREARASGAAAAGGCDDLRLDAVSTEHAAVLAHEVHGSGADDRVLHESILTAASSRHSPLKNRGGGWTSRFRESGAGRAA
jgi:hypothetical protein